MKELFKNIRERECLPGRDAISHRTSGERCPVAAVVVGIVKYMVVTAVAGMVKCVLVVCIYNGVEEVHW
jgi:hypothetical protein